MATGTNNPPGSTDPRDLYANAQNLDLLLTGPQPFYPDRLGVQRYSWEGMEFDFAAAQSGRQIAFQQFLAGSGFEAPVSYAAGVTLERVTQTFVRDNVQYRIKDPVDLPYTLTGNWATESENFAVMGDSGLRQDLAGPTGASNIGYGTENVAGALDRLAAVFMSPATYGVQSVEQGGTDPIAQKAAWESLRAAAESLSATVIVEPGTYVLPPEVRLNANNTTWLFKVGAVLKLYDTQVDTKDFLVFWQPVNQKVVGLRFDANRAAQNSAQFGIDKSGCIVVDPTNCQFEYVQIVSSPAKGFAVVGSVGGTVNGISVVGVTGGNCMYQAVLFDGNNMNSTWKGANFLDRVFIGDTGHAGVAINDGVHNLLTGLIICDVNNTVWDAISIRDCWDIQMATNRGLRGRNGVQVWSLNTLSRRIDLGDSWGEGNSQSGVAITGARDIRGGTCGGRNNAIAGLNIGQRNVSGVLTTSKRVSIANPVGFDDRTTPVQQYGLFVGGADDVSFGSRGTIYGNVTKNVSIIRAAPTTNVAYPLVKRVLDQSFTLASGASTDVVCTFDEPFDDAQYDVLVETSVSAGLTIWATNIRAKTGAAVTVHLVALTGSAGSGTVSVTCTRRP